MAKIDIPETPNNSNKAKEAVANPTMSNPSFKQGVEEKKPQVVATSEFAPAKPKHPVVTAVAKNTKEKVIPALLDVGFSAAISAVGIGLSYLFFHDESHATQFNTSLNSFKNIVAPSGSTPMNIANASYYQGGGYNYNGMYNQPTAQTGPAQSVFSYKQMSWPTRQDAEAVLFAMQQYEDANSTDHITVAALYEMTSHDNEIIQMMWHWGWYDLSGASTYSYYDPAWGAVRWKLNLPNAIKID